MTFPKWKSIIINWVNCYGHNAKEFSELLDFKILSNIVLKFGVEENHSYEPSQQLIETFVGQNYPKFTFESNSLNQASEKDICVIASVLLFHVCVSPKNVKMKTKMCNKLNSEDQEMIMKYTKLLMDKDSLEYNDFLTAINDVNSADTSLCLTPDRLTSNQSVSTPPVMKMLHERNRDIKFLTAALETEKFDRTFLQDELARTQAKLEKVLQKNSMYEKELSSLRIQIDRQSSDCIDIDTTENETNVEQRNLKHEVEQLEDRLASVLTELDVTNHNVKLLNAKAEELKQQRDEYAKQGHDMLNQTLLLSNELENHKRLNAQLQEVNNELRNHLHRQHNVSVECDEFDSAQMNRSCLQDQSSVCEEACLGVVEIQLNEERARTMELSNTNQQLLTKIHDMEFHQQDLMRRLIDQRNFLRNQIKDNATLAKSFNARLESVTCELEEVSEAALSLQHSVDFTKKLNDMIADVVGDMKSEIASKKSEIRRQEGCMKDMECTLAQMMRDIKAITKCVEKQSKNYEESLHGFQCAYECKINAVTSHIDSLKHLTNVLSHHISVTVREKELEITSLSDNLERSSKERIELEKTYADQKSHLEYTIENCQMTIEQLNGLLQSEIELKTNIQNNLSSEIVDLKKLLREAENDIKMYEDKCNKLLDYLKEKDAKIENLNDNNAQLRNNLESYDLEMKNKNLYIDDMLAKHRDLTESSEKELAQCKYDYELKLTDLSISLLAAQTHQKTTESDLQAKDDDLKKMKEKYEQIQESLNCLRNDYNLLFEQNVKLNTEINNNNAEIEGLKDEVIIQNNEYKGRVDELSRELKAKIQSNADMESNLKKNEEKLEAIISNVAQALECILKNVSDPTQFELAVKSLLAADSNELVSNLQRLQESIVTLRKNNDELASVCNVLKVEKEAKLTKLESKINDLNQSVANRDELVKNIKTGKDDQIASLQDKIDTLSTNLAGTSEELKTTVANLEKVIGERDTEIVSLHSEVAFLKNVLADSQNKHLDLKKEIETSRENYESLSKQFKKTVELKNEAISDLERQLNKSNINASQIIKLSSRYQLIIQKRISELKTNGALKDLTHLSNVSSKSQDSNNKKCFAGVTLDDLERFLEYTEKHSKKLFEKYIALQQEHAKLKENENIHESEKETMRKYLRDLVDHFTTMGRIRDTYNIKMNKITSIHKGVRKEISNIENLLQDNVKIRLERRLSSAVEESNEIYVAMCRWLSKCIEKSVSNEKIQQVLNNESPMLSCSDFQNTGLEVQIDELQNGVKSLLEELSLAKKGELKGKTISSSVLEIRAEYEEKLERMKTRMKQLYQDQIISYKEKQQLEIKSLQAELHKTREQLAHRSKAYEDHIAGLTKELWTYGEKLLMEKNEVEWLRRKHSTSLMSLQNLNSFGPPLPRRESLSVSNTRRGVKHESRGLQMEDEDGEVFDNRHLNELKASPPKVTRDKNATIDYRLSELQWRNSLCPPHLKSSYPAETQFRSGLREDDIKSEASATQTTVEKKSRKEVGITAYKKPGPPTPSKAAGRLSATDSELRESLRFDQDPGGGGSRKTSTPSRIRSLFRSARHDQENSLTPRSRRISIFNRKK